MKRSYIRGFWGSLFLLTGVTNGEAQVYNNGSLFIQPGASLYVEGDLVNTSSSSFSNLGLLTVKGNITNDALLTAFTGSKTILGGTAVQTISGTAPFRVTDIDINNTAGILLSQQLYVTGSLAFLAGVITAPDAGSGVFFDGSGVSVSGATDGRHINGWSSVVNRTSFEFPIGNGSLLKRVLVSNIQVSANPVGVIFNGNNNKAVNGTSYETGLIDVSNNWYSIQAPSNTADIHLPVNETDDYGSALSIDYLRVVRKDPSIWTILPSTFAGTLADGAISSAAVSGFGSFALGVHSVSLPVTLLGFTGKKVSGGADLDWKVSGNEDADTYFVEKSSDGLNWITAGQVPARNIGSDANYALHDPFPYIPVTHYRLRILERNGKYHFSKIVTLRFDEWGLSLYPTLVHTNGPVIRNHNGRVYHAMLTDMSGKVYHRFKILPGTGLVPVGGLPAGKYLVMVSDPLPVVVLSFVKQ